MSMRSTLPAMKSLVAMVALLDKTAMGNESGMLRVVELPRAARLNACSAAARMAAWTIWMVRTWAGGSSSNGDIGVLDTGEIAKFQHFTLSLSSSSSQCVLYCLSCSLGQHGGWWREYWWYCWENRYTYIVLPFHDDTLL